VSARARSDCVREHPPSSLLSRPKGKGKDEAIGLVTSGKGPQTQEISCHALISLIQLVLHLQSTKLAPSPIYPQATKMDGMVRYQATYSYLTTKGMSALAGSTRKDFKEKKRLQFTCHTFISISPSSLIGPWAFLGL